MDFGKTDPIFYYNGYNVDYIFYSNYANCKEKVKQTGMVFLCYKYYSAFFMRA